MTNTPDDLYITEDEEAAGEFMEKVVEMIPDLASADLEMIISLAQDALSKARDREAKHAIEELEAVAKKHGFNIDELLAKKAETMISQRTGEPVRFRHPKDPSMTWTGRGRMPAWLKEVKEAGGDIEEFRIRP
ncbi:H-NS family nucleoid-associated regulatory protein [Paracoccus sulfuroxidans]|uniref:DNA-binding protein H-NS n=1 Tax=Paracoccus sulfuroxidans TaxID=384678 RepID=A0A562P1X8_9RHOB|nr:H-NS histone family protein [Paracoccus sulfuroxidans]TWI38240.1 DNA-binding protein H-NS [Paracoccus sulfuroxidans]